MVPRIDRRFHRATLPIVALAVVLATAACTTSSAGGLDSSAPSSERQGGSSATPDTTPATTGQAYRDHGVSFWYPNGWRRMELADASASTGTFDWTATVGIDPRNIVNVSRSTIGTPVTRADIGAKTGSITLQIRSLFTQAGGSLTRGPVALDVAGLPALRYSGRARTPAGGAVHTLVILAFAGTTEYELACQYEREAAERIRAGCDRVVSTFSVQG